MTDAAFRARLDTLGIKLDDRAFGAAFKGAQHLRTEPPCPWRRNWRFDSKSVSLLRLCGTETQLRPRFSRAGNFQPARC